MNHGVSYWSDLYRNRREIYGRFSNQLRDVLAVLLAAQHIAYVDIWARAKSVESFEQKLLDKGAKYADPLLDVTDLAAVRIVLIYSDDEQPTANLLRSEFQVVEETNTSDRLASDAFGYRSIHYLLKTKPPRSDLPEWHAFEDLTAEVQVRSAFQHAWAVAEHENVYKALSEGYSDEPVKRQFARMAALVESLDHQLAEIRVQAQQVVALYRERINAGVMESVVVDSVALDVYFEVTQQAEHWSAAAEAVGFRGRRAVTEESLRNDKRALLRVLRATGVVTLDQLHDVLTSAEPWGSDFLRAVNAPMADAGSHLYASPYRMVMFIVLRAKEAPQEAYGLANCQLAVEDAIKSYVVPGDDHTERGNHES